jgi:hypothetical protein
MRVFMTLSSVTAPLSWEPVLYPERPEDAGVVHDLIEDQLEELVRSREPGRAWTRDDLEDAKDAACGGTVRDAYGSWVFYPWSGRVVHVLPRDEFREVRADRNRGKISAADQRGLAGRTIAVIGLSVGNSAALTCAMEGVGGTFRLADHDRLGLSNLNRLRAGVADLGLPKTVLCARQIAEIDPYAKVQLFDDGVTEDTIDAFFTKDGLPDLLIEECDTPWVKIASREHARHHGVPVLMDTNDRGMLDVERFDHEPERPLLHGLIGGTRSEDVRDLDAKALRALLLSMVEAERLSPEMTAALPEVGRTLSSWPQLASGVVLGGALVTDAARRILTGHPVPSGRYRIDLAELIR